MEKMTFHQLKIEFSKWARQLHFKDLHGEVLHKARLDLMKWLSANGWTWDDFMNKMNIPPAVLSINELARIKEDIFTDTTIKDPQKLWNEVKAANHKSFNGDIDDAIYQYESTTYVS